MISSRVVRIVVVVVVVVVVAAVVVVVVVVVVVAVVVVVVVVEVVIVEIVIVIRVIQQGLKYWMACRSRKRTGSWLLHPDIQKTLDLRNHTIAFTEGSAVKDGAPPLAQSIFPLAACEGLDCM